ncbi:MAG: ATP-binding protein [Pseudomonadales bacterium]
MGLNKQLVCVSLLLLSLPWAGCQYLKEMDNSLRLGQESNLQATAEVIARALQQNPAALNPHGQVGQPASSAPVFYCHSHDTPIWADGYDDEWLEIPWTDYASADGQYNLRYRCAISGSGAGKELGLFFAVPDEQVMFNNPVRSLASNGDRLVLATGSGREYIFTAVAPGSITARYLNDSGATYRESRIDASWVDQDKGYQLEIKMPLHLAAGRLSFLVIDESPKGVNSYGPLLSSAEPPWFSYQSSSSEQAIAAFSQAGLRLRLTDPNGWLIASAGNPESKKKSQAHWLLSKLYRALLSSNQVSKIPYSNGVNFTERAEVKEALQGAVSSRWYRDPNRSDHHILTTAVPIEHEGQAIAVLVAEQSSEQTAGLTDQAFSRLFLLSFAVISLTALALLAYANWLSWRIRRLNRATQQALADQSPVIGQPFGHLRSSRANDEIDSLTLSYAELMRRIQEYTNYLHTLARKLSHELRTPLAIIHSSLDNLASQPLDEQSDIYQQRAKDGALRLGGIITAMSESRRVEESIEQAELEAINIAGLLQDISRAYRDTYRHHGFVLRGLDEASMEDAENVLMAAPDLLVQMLDKLIDNACSFAPEGSDIEIGYEVSATNITINIGNDGPLLPEAMQTQLFDNMVSLREKDNDRPHLGMGLHIVDLIVKYHQGSVIGRNRSDSSGVIFTVVLPKATKQKKPG